MIHRSFAACLCLIFAAVTGASAQPHSITIDGDFSDWQAVPVAHSSSNNAPGSSGIVFQSIRMTNDERFLFIKFELNLDIDLSQNNGVRLYLDTDPNSNAGVPINSINANLLYRFGDRFGAFYPPTGGVQTIHFTNIRLRALPSYNSNRYELAIARNATVSGHPVFPSDTIRIVLWDSPGGDMMPETGTQVSYTFADGSVGTEAIPLDREQPTDLRLATFNVWNDGPWQPGKGPRFGRLLQATDPDVIMFQEIYNHSAQQAKDFVAQWVDEFEPGSGWFAVGSSDTITVSRFPILGTWNIFGNSRAALIRPIPIMDGRILVINVHLPCCGNDSGRQNQVDAIMAFVRDAKQPGGQLTLDEGTPIVISGDMNFVGDAQQLETLLTGNIVNNGSWGPSFAPDWDGSDLTQAIPRQTEKRMGYTWRNDANSGNYWPGHLDFHIYTDSVIELGRNYTVWTPEMSSEVLNQYGLLVNDSLASDHLLFIADFRHRVKQPCEPADLNCDGAVNVSDLLILFDNWGNCSDCGDCPADLNEDCVVNVSDLLILFDNWG